MAQAIQVRRQTETGRGAATTEGGGIRVVRVAVAGCGVVGSELIRQIREQTLDLAREDQIRLEVVSVLVRRPALSRDLALAPDRFTGDRETFLNATADVVVEAIGGTDVALEIARRTLAGGRRLVTANKTLLAAHGAELAELARLHGGQLDFEAAVGGGVPVIRALRDSLSSSGIKSVQGILNGTTNYILTRLSEGDQFAGALKSAQRLGFAEVDPSRDLSGADAADKIAVLGWLAFGADPARLEVRTRGISDTADRFAADARALGGVPRVVARVERRERGVTAVVEPVIVAPDTVLARTRDERNVVVLETRWNGTIVLSGPGAGGSPTAAVLLADVRRGARSLAAPPIVPVLSAAEIQPHRWVISTLRSAGIAADLRSLLRQAGVRPDRIEVDSAARVVRTLLEPTPWQQVETLVERLSAAGVVPVASRLEGF